MPKQKDHPVLNHLVVHTQSLISERYDGPLEFPPLPYHKIISFVAIHVDDSWDPTWTVKVSSNEPSLLRQLNRSLSIKDSHLVTMYGRNYTLPLILQRFFAHSIQSPHLYDIYRLPDIGRQHHELTDLFTNRGSRKWDSLNNYASELLNIGEVKSPKPRAIDDWNRKTLKREIVGVTAAMAFIWLRQLAVKGTLDSADVPVLAARIARNSPILKKKLKKWAGRL